MLGQKDGKTYALRESNGLVYELDNKVFEDATAELHGRQIAKFNVDDVIELTLGAEPALTFRKAGDAWSYAADPVLPIDGDKVKEVLKAVSDIKTHRYVDYDAQNMADYGLDTPAARLAVAVAGGDRVEILLSATGPTGDADQSRYAALAAFNKVFLLKADQVETFGKTLENFEKAQ